MAYQTIFKRYELKYLLTKEQKEKVVQAIRSYMALDQYGRTTIRNIYFDTENYRLVRRSLESPAYKEKLRIRSYCRAAPDSAVFVELKKKFQKVVYKRRIALPEQDAMDWVTGRRDCPGSCQISAEVDYFLQYYGSLTPAVFLSYDREAFYSKDHSDFRVTFDGLPVLPEGMALMEIKCSGGIPMWMIQILSREKLYKTSFSKYGTAYQTIIYPHMKKEAVYSA